MAARAQRALQHLTRRDCSSAANAVSVASFATGRDRAAQGIPRAARAAAPSAGAYPPAALLAPTSSELRCSTIAQLEAFASALFKAAGLDADKAATLAQLLVLTDALGRRTHGLAMAPLYLAELAKGTMAKSGEPEVVKQRGVVALWDGGYLPGQYVVARAIDWALPRAAEQRHRRGRRSGAATTSAAWPRWRCARSTRASSR